MTYNVHACLGTDGQRRVERIAQVIDRYQPDVVALQELDLQNPRSGLVDQAARIAELSHRSFHFTAARSDERGAFGNATLTARPFQVVSEGALPVRWGEQRSAHRLRIDMEDFSLDFINTHLSIHLYERVLQTKALLSEEPLKPAGSSMFPALGSRTERLVLCGDLNAGSWSPIYRGLVRRLQDTQPRCGRPTWPSRYPCFRLDHIWIGRCLSTRTCFVPKDELTRVASDHLPVIADLVPLPLPSDETDPAPVAPER